MTTTNRRRETHGYDAVTMKVLASLPPRQTFTRADAIRRTKCPVCKERLLKGWGKCPDHAPDPHGYHAAATQPHR